MAGELRAPLILSEPLAEGNSAIRVPLVTLDPLAEGSAALLGSLLTAEPLTEGFRNLRQAFIFIETLYPVEPEGTVSTELFPGTTGSGVSLPGLAYDVGKKPRFSTGKHVASSGVSVRTAYQQYPIWEFEFTYEFISDDRSAGTSSLQSLMGFFLSRQGGFDTFLYKDTQNTDYSVTGGQLAIADGVTTQFPFVRTLGGFAEKVGQVDNGLPINIYLNGVLQSSGYTITMPNNVVFTTAPAAGTVITADFEFFFNVVFQEDHADFKRFADKLWNLQTIVLETVPQ